MVKGNSKQVIVVHSPDQKLFEQAIFILKDGAVGEQGITDEALLREARQIVGRGSHRRRWYQRGPIWACGGAALTGALWAISMLC